MTALVATRNERGAATVRIGDADLHRAASKSIHEANHVVFESLPSVIRQIIEHKTWRTFGHKTFGTYALDSTSNGLGVNTNQRLWLLRCSLDIHDKHIKEWADTLEEVEKMVKAYAVEEGKRIRDFNGNSLETLAKDGVLASTRITYLPSRQVGGGSDGHLIRLRRRQPDVFRKVIRGELSMVDARRAAGMKVDRVTNLGRAQSAVRMMTKRERAEFMEWLKAEDYL